MPRLIDADAFIEFIRNLPKTENGYSREYDESDIIHYINEQPTAYDVEKVVEQIKREQYDIPECSYERGFNAMARFAQKVVRKCGVE